MNNHDVIGVFMGLEKSSYEYVAWLIAPYKPGFEIEIGSLLLIQNTWNQIVARVTDYSPRGEFISTMGEKWLNDIASEGIIDEIGQDIKKSKVSYRVRIKVLGSLSDDGFSPGVRSVPQITSKVMFPDKEALQKIIGEAMLEQSQGVHIGSYSLDSDIKIMFDQKELNSKRTFIFARAGYGKSNLMKVLCSEWKAENGGLLVFDQEGEYATTDKKGRPGIMDRRGALLITNRTMPADLKNVYTTIGLNLTELPPGLIIPFLIPKHKHELIFYLKLMGMNRQSWSELVNLFYTKRWNASYQDVERIVLGTHPDADNAQGSKEVDVKPMLNNLIPPILKIHDPGSNMIEIIKKALSQGRVVIFDISRIDSHTARQLCSIIIKDIFEENKEDFITLGGKNLIRATFVLEEAHTVLSDSGSASAPSAFVDLAKEGRKYELGGIFITQQPGSIPSEIVSQGDNFFVFHLLSKGDLTSLSNANAHYSSDIITQILSEPIRGKSYMWTSHQPFVIPIKVVHFEDPNFTQPNQSIRVQDSEDILGNLTDQIVKEVNDPLYVSICGKFRQVEGDASLTDKKRPGKLFEMLSDDEKGYLRNKNAIQSGYGGEYAIKYPFYYELRRKLGTIGAGS